MVAPLILWGLFGLGAGALVVKQTSNAVDAQKIGVAQSAIAAGLVDEPSDFDRIFGSNLAPSSIIPNINGISSVGNGFDDVYQSISFAKTLLLAGGAYYIYKTVRG